MPERTAFTATLSSSARPRLRSSVSSSGSVAQNAARYSPSPGIIDSLLQTSRTRRAGDIRRTGARKGMGRPGSSMAARSMSRSPAGNVSFSTSLPAASDCRTPLACSASLGAGSAAESGFLPRVRPLRCRRSRRCARLAVRASCSYEGADTVWRRRGERKATGRPGAFPGPPLVDRGGDDPAAVLVGMALQLLATGAPDAARQWLDRAAAEARDPALLRAIGVIYWQHLNAERKAEACLRRAAAAGSIDAMSDLGVLLRRHNKIHEAERWLVRAASSGDASALNNLGNLFEQRGDLPGAIEAWSRAANQGSLMAMATLGLVLSAHGDVAEARQWRDRAAEVLRQGGHPEASNQEILGKLLLVDTMLAGEPAPKRDPPSRA